jgi:hypothetical protein
MFNFNDFIEESYLDSSKTPLYVLIELSKINTEYSKLAINIKLKLYV